MDTQKLGIISLIKAAITGEYITLPSDFDFEQALDTAKKHQIANLLYYGAENCRIDTNTPVVKTLFSYLCKAIAVSEKQKFEVNNVCKAFSDNNIDHMPLKGTILRELYPHSDMRIMSDADILIKTEQYDSIRKIMLELGFNEGKESNHELIWKKSGIVIELHKRLIPSYNKDYYAYYGNGWQLATPSETVPHRYKMSDDDQMIYLFTHFAKHFRGGGIGLRHITDLYVYRRYTKMLNEEYIESELKKLKLHEFYINIIDTLDVWFNGAAGNEKTECITEYIFNSGVYGHSSQRKMSEIITLKNKNSLIKNEKHQRMLRLLFPTLENMKFHFRFLEKFPFLLPITWIIRIFKIVFFKGSKAKSYYNNMKSISSENIDDYKQELHYMGLDFNFEE